MINPDLITYFEEQLKEEPEVDVLKDFYSLCARIKNDFYRDWENRENSRASLEIQKRAIIGYKKEKEFFKNRISELISEGADGDCIFPAWYESLTDGVFHENWGFAGLAEWFEEKYSDSSSAKIIGNKIYFLENGKMTLKPQTISEERKEQMIKAFLLLTPEERMDKAYHETYLLDGTRVTVFTEPMAKKGQSCIVFRRYLIPRLSFEEQALRGTIPFSIIPLLTSMVDVGFNTVFLGAVRTAKTTFLSTWQSYEDPSLEGVMVETDPEIPIHNILPDSPIVQLIADGDELLSISKNLLRSDADYFILAEARDGIALDTAVRLAAKGTKRMKMTFHSRLPNHFPLEAATEIVKKTGGDLKLTMQMVASGFDYIFHFIQLKDKSQKRLKGIYEMSCDDMGKISIYPICEYLPSKDDWVFHNYFSADKIAYGEESNSAAFEQMRFELETLAFCSQEQYGYYNDILY